MLFKKRCSIINFPLFWRKCCQRQAKSIGGFVLVMCEDQVFGLQAGLSLSIFEVLGFRWAWVVQNLLQTGSRGFFISDVRASGFCASGGFEWCKICLGWRVVPGLGSTHHQFVIHWWFFITSLSHKFCSCPLTPSLSWDLTNDLAQTQPARVISSAPMKSKQMIRIIYNIHHCYSGAEKYQ